MKQLGISLDLTIYRNGKDITQEECDQFLYDVIDLVEERGLYAGGGAHLVDINKEL